MFGLARNLYKYLRKRQERLLTLVRGLFVRSHPPYVVRQISGSSLPQRVFRGSVHRCVALLPHASREAAGFARVGLLSTLRFTASTRRVGTMDI
jgi:hypothetical protein